MAITVIAKNLRFLRKRNGWMQSEMEDRSGVRQRNWSNWENAVSEPDISTIISLSNLFGISIDALLTVDLEENVHLNENEDGKKNKENVHLNVHPSVHLNQKKEEISERKEQTDLLILKQLNYIADQVTKIDEKLDRHGN